MFETSHSKYHERTPDYIIDAVLQVCKDRKTSKSFAKHAVKIVCQNYEARLDNRSRLSPVAYLGAWFVVDFNEMCDWQL